MAMPIAMPTMPRSSSGEFQAVRSPWRAGEDAAQRRADVLAEDVGDPEVLFAVVQREADRLCHRGHGLGLSFVEGVPVDRIALGKRLEPHPLERCPGLGRYFSQTALVGLRRQRPSFTSLASYSAMQSRSSTRVPPDEELWPLSRLTLPCRQKGRRVSRM